MKAIRYEQYGKHDVLFVSEVETPTPGPGQVLVKVGAASVTRADTMMRSGRPALGRLMLGLFKPRYPVVGTGFAGEVVAIGDQVTRFKVGERLFGESIFGSGTNAEYLCVDEYGVVAHTPANLTDAEACGICDGPLTSLNFLRDIGKLLAGQKLLVAGASGSLGSAAVQIGKLLGAEVTAVCSGANAIWVKDLGADRVIDYTQQDFTQESVQYDLIFDTVGQYAFCDGRRVLKQSGSYLTPVFSMRNIVSMLLTRIGNGPRLKFSATGMRPHHELAQMLEELKELFAEGRMQSVQDRHFSLEETASAHAYVESGHKKGNVVVMPFTA
ncbi:MAG: NAD(P)-dependent alcohol dehydrogenase [Gammaproteobacteria bacterium]|nr:NAD(P)-dependent alcohol dehydrogenase [Gammaproteobacteria bacterium]